MSRRWLLRLYPSQWRARYGDEFAALLEDCPLTPALALDVVAGALDSHLQAFRSKERIVTQQSLHRSFLAYWILVTCAGISIGIGAFALAMILIARTVEANAAFLAQHLGLLALQRTVGQAGFPLGGMLVGGVLGAVQAFGVPALRGRRRTWVIGSMLGGLLGGLIQNSFDPAPWPSTWMLAGGLAFCQGLLIARRPAHIVWWALVMISACAIGAAFDKIIGSYGALGMSDLITLLLVSAVYGGFTGDAVRRLDDAAYRPPLAGA